MQILTQYVGKGQTLAQAVDLGTNALVVYGKGNTYSLSARNGAVGVWIAFRGTLGIRSMREANSIRRGEILVTGQAGHFEAAASAGAVWAAVVAEEWAWCHALACAIWPRPRPIPGLFTEHMALHRAIAAAVRATTDVQRADALRNIAMELAEEQMRARARIARCPGRTYAHKLRAFLQLQKARRAIQTQCDAELNNAALARLANYSPHHFLRMFELVYEETPHQYLLRKRLERAARLLRTSQLAVTEIAFASGFENASAFSRSFRKRFGTTAKSIRYREDHALTSA